MFYFDHFLQSLHLLTWYNATVNLSSAYSSEIICSCVCSSLSVSSLKDIHYMIKSLQGGLIVVLPLIQPMAIFAIEVAYVYTTNIMRRAHLLSSSSTQALNGVVTNFLASV